MRKPKEGELKRTVPITGTDSSTKLALEANLPPVVRYWADQLQSADEETWRMFIQDSNRTIFKNYINSKRTLQTVPATAFWKWMSHLLFTTGSLETSTLRIDPTKTLTEQKAKCDELKFGGRPSSNPIHRAARQEAVAAAIAAHKEAKISGVGHGRNQARRDREKAREAIELTALQSYFAEGTLDEVAFSSSLLHS